MSRCFSLCPFCLMQKYYINSHCSRLVTCLLPLVFFCLMPTLFPRMSLSPSAAPDLPLRLLQNSFSVYMTCRGKDGNNLMQPCSSVSPDSGVTDSWLFRSLSCCSAHIHHIREIKDADCELTSTNCRIPSSTWGRAAVVELLMSCIAWK